MFDGFLVSPRSRSHSLSLSLKIDAAGKLSVLINGKVAKVDWPADEPNKKKLPIDQELYAFVSFPRGAEGRVEIKGQSGVGLSFAEQALRKKLRLQVFDAVACGEVVGTRLAFAAVQEGNVALLRTMADNHVQSNVQIGSDILRTPLEDAVLANNLAIIKELLPSVERRHVKRSGDTGPFPNNTIKADLDTGAPAAHTFTHRVGKIGAARGGKEGDGAFITW
jgi:hypothetical protein